jgi:hypothetical protein
MRRLRKIHPWLGIYGSEYIVYLIFSGALTYPSQGLSVVSLLTVIRLVAHVAKSTIARIR